MLEGMVVVSELITHYRMVEYRYLHGNSATTAHLRSGLVKLYVYILGFLDRACRYYQQERAKRWAKSLFSGAAGAIDQLLKQISSQQVEVDRRIALVEYDNDTTN